MTSNYTNDAYDINICHMGQISQPQHKNAAAGENRDIGPFRKGSFMIDFNAVLLDLENSDIAAVSFLGTKTKKIVYPFKNEYFVLVSSKVTA